MSRKLRETIEFTVGMLVLVGLMAAMFLVIGGCGTHRMAVREQPQTPAATTTTEDVAGEPFAPNLPPFGTSAPVGLLRPVFFDFDRYHIRPDQRFALENAATAIQKADVGLVALEGHADERGTSDYNLALGQRRADTVRRNLINLGVRSDIRTVSFGEDRPVDRGQDEAAYARNRRVEFVIFQGD